MYIDSFMQLKYPYSAVMHDYNFVHAYRLHSCMVVHNVSTDEPPE